MLFRNKSTSPVMNQAAGKKSFPVNQLVQRAALNQLIFSPEKSRAPAVNEAVVVS